MVSFCRLFLFTDGGICTPSVKRSSFIRACDRHKNRWIAVPKVELSVYCGINKQVETPPVNENSCNEITIFFNTTSPNKIRDARRIYKALNLHIRILPIAVLTDGPVRTAEKQSATYQGNLEEKFEAATIRLCELGEDFITKRLHELSVEPSKAYVCAHDGGVSLPSHILDHPHFDCLRQTRTPVKLGVETKFVLHQMHGAKALNNVMNAAYGDFRILLEDRIVIE